MIKGVRCITITEKAVEVILEQLERERLQYAEVIKKYDCEIQDIREMIGSDRKCYWAPNCITPETAISRRWEK